MIKIETAELIYEMWFKELNQFRIDMPRLIHFYLRGKQALP